MKNNFTLTVTRRSRKGPAMSLGSELPKASIMALKRI